MKFTSFSGENTAKSTKTRENSIKIIQKDIFCYYLMLYQFEILESRLYVGKIKSSRFHTYHVVLSANVYESNSILFTNNKLISFQK